jgi:hypothetical protein
MKILSFIEDPEVIKKILKHLGLWDIKARPPPKATAPPPNLRIDYFDSQLPLLPIFVTIHNPLYAPNPQIRLCCGHFFLDPQ